jgi:predicted alpha-1,2-mannosidase
MKERKICHVLALLIISILGSVEASPFNISPQAKITASSHLNARTLPGNVADGIISVDGKGEWACEGDTTDWGYVRFPWIQLEWETPRKVNRVILYDRPDLKDHIAGGKILFSDGSMLWVNEIPNDGLAKEIRFDTKTISWIKFLTTDGKGRDIGFSEIEVFSTENSDYVSWVDPYIETNRGRYIFFIPGQRPFGMASAAPLTRNKNQNGGGYNYNDTEVLGFEQIHHWMVGGLEVMPGTDKTDRLNGQQGWKSKFSHASEIVHPGYHRLFLEKNKIWVENTATDRVSLYRFTYTKSSTANILTNLSGYVSNSTMTDAKVKKVNQQEFEGSMSTVKRYWGGPNDVKIFFVIQFDKAFASLDGWQDGKVVKNVNGVSGDHAGISAAFDIKAGDQINMKIGISFTSTENARNNLNKECEEWDFDKVRDESLKIWDNNLSKIKVNGGPKDQKTKFYTDLWHVLLGRHKITDISGDYPDRTTGQRIGTFTNADLKIRTVPKTETGKNRFDMYSSDAWWLTQWNLNVLWGLAWPEVMDEMSASMIEYSKNGYLLPRGPSGGGYSYIMTGCPAVNLIASSIQKGLLTKVSLDDAYIAMKQNMLPGGMLGDSADIEFYTANGYWRDNAGISLEAAFQDYALSEVAAKLRKTEDHRFFSNRAKGWKTLFNKKHNLIFPKSAQGEFLHDDPLSGRGWIEANAWQATWSVSHDIAGLSKMMGGNNILCDKLNFAFTKAEPSDFVFAYNDGYVSYANQPGCSNAHVFNHAGKPWLSQYWVRKVREKAYSGVTPDVGYGGHDEDQGQMGGVSALMSIGLFSLKGNVDQNPTYEITSPIFDSVEIELDQKYYKGKKFTILTKNNSGKNMYIQSASLGGKPLNNYWFKHSDFARGGTLVLNMGSKPNVNWGVGNVSNSK